MSFPHFAAIAMLRQQIEPSRDGDADCEARPDTSWDGRNEIEDRPPASYFASQLFAAQYVTTS